MKIGRLKYVVVLSVLSTSFIFGCKKEPEAVPNPTLVSFDESSIVVPETGSAQSISLSLDIPATEAVTVTIEIASEDATYNEHYTTNPDGNSGTFSVGFAKGEQTVSFTFTPIDNDSIDSDKTIKFSATKLGDLTLDEASEMLVFIENDEISTLLLKEDFDNVSIVNSDLNNAFTLDSWIQVNGNGQVFSEGSDQTINGFVGSGVGGSLTFDNTSDSQTGTTFLNIARRFLDSDVKTSLDEQTYVPNTYYAAFNFTLNELDAATAVRRYVSLGKLKNNDDATAIATEWGAKMGIKGIVVNGVQKYIFGLHKRIGVNGIWGDMVVPDDSIKRDLGTTYLVVLKVEQTDNVEAEQGVDPSAEQSNSIAYMYVFEEGEDYSVEPATPYAVDEAAGDVNINALILLGDQNNHSATYDGIRVANDWRSLFSE